MGRVTTSLWNAGVDFFYFLANLRLLQCALHQDSRVDQFIEKFSVYGRVHNIARRRRVGHGSILQDPIHPNPAT